MNEIGKVTGKSRRAPGRPRAAPADMRWLDRLEPLDADAAAAALERPGPDVLKGVDWVARFAGTLDEDFARGALGEEGLKDNERRGISPA